MRIKIKPAPWCVTKEWLSIDAEALEIDGQPYVPPAPEQPKVQRWECEVTFGAQGGADYIWKTWASSHGGQGKARVKLGFDSTGRVWFADKDAQRLADRLRSAPSLPISIADLNAAADRLAGPEK